MLEDQFDFVLLAEFFDESLVILAKRFCWDLEQANYSDLLWEKTRSGRGYWFSPWKEPGVAQVRYLKQNSRRKDAVSKMTLETRETLEVNINFATLQCFFCPGMACYWLQTLQPLSSSFWGRNLEVGKGMSKYLAVMERKLLQEMWTSCNGWTSSLKKNVFLPIPTIPGWVAIWGED